MSDVSPMETVPARTPGAATLSGRRSVLDLLWSTIRLAVASLLVGAGLNFLHVGPDRLLSAFGLTPEEALEILNRAVAWALPNMIFGSAVLIPFWLAVHVLRPPSRPEDR
jgi:uncharacterized membrane protein YphA (DoxX/SURF4 family)